MPAQASSWLGRARQRFWRLAPADDGAVVLRHHRIYILPTPRGWALIATLLVMLVTSTNYALSLGYGFTFLLAGLFSSALLHAFRNLAGIAAAPLAVGEAFAGGTLAFTLSLANTGAARDDISVASAAASVRVDVPARATRPLTIAVPAPIRGRQALGRLTLSSDYPLGLWRGWAYVHFPFEGVVYPSPEATPAPFPAAESGSNAQQVQRGPEVEFFGLRDYRPGDPLRRIAWKAVARGTGWYTKEFHGEGGKGALAFDWSRLPPGLDVEARLSRICAWILAAEREGRPFSLAMPGTALASGHGAAHRRAALTALACFPPA